MDDLTDRTFCITGANTGIGRQTAVALARRGARLIMLNRSRQRSEDVLADVASAGGRAELVECDLGDLASVAAAAEQVLALDEPIHVLINNAGLASQRGVTAQGFELAFGVNHLGHFALTALLLPRLRESAPARVVNVSSDAHYRARGIDFDAVRQPTASVTGIDEYGVSKLANLLHAQELARREDPDVVSSYALHPGVIASDIWRRVPWPIRPIMTRFMRSAEEGAATTLRCATDPAVADQTGLYWDDEQPKTPSRHATPELAAELWRRSEEWTA